MAYNINKKTLKNRNTKSYLTRLENLEEITINTRVMGNVQQQIALAKQKRKKLSEYQIENLILQERTKEYNKLSAERQRIYKKYEIAGIRDYNELKDMPIDRIQKYYQREKRILSGQYEKYRDKLWINNYISSLQQAGASKETIKDFKKLLKGYSVDTLSNMLPTINIYYPQTDEYGKKQVDEAIENLQKDMLILRGVIKIKDDNTITLYKDPDKNNNNNR